MIFCIFKNKTGLPNWNKHGRMVSLKLVPTNGHLVASGRWGSQKRVCRGRWCKSWLNVHLELICAASRPSMFPNAGSWIAQYDFFSFAWGIFLFFWIFQTVFLIKGYLVVYRLTEYIGYLFTFCSFFYVFTFFTVRMGRHLDRRSPRKPANPTGPHPYRRRFSCHIARHSPRQKLPAYFA